MRRVRSTAPVVLTAVPDRNRPLSDGVLVEASILARVLGIRLLKLHATVVLVPADVAAPSAAPREPRPRPREFARRRSGPTGRGLADAVRSLNEGAELLAEARRNGA